MCVATVIAVMCTMPKKSTTKFEPIINNCQSWNQPTQLCRRRFVSINYFEMRRFTENTQVGVSTFSGTHEQKRRLWCNSGMKGTKAFQGDNKWSKLVSVGMYLENATRSATWGQRRLLTISWWRVYHKAKIVGEAVQFQHGETHPFTKDILGYLVLWKMLNFNIFRVI